MLDVDPHRCGWHEQVGSVQLAALQKLLQEANGVYGARLSGAGTRGACVALVRADAAEAVAQQACCAASLRRLSYTV